MILNRYIIFRNSGAGEQIAQFDEGEEREVLADLKALGKSYLVYDKVTDTDYTYTSFKKRFGIRDSFSNEKEYKGIKYSFYRGIYRIELEKRDYVYCESEEEVFDIIDAYLKDIFKMRLGDSIDINPKDVFNINTIEASNFRNQKDTKAYIKYMTPKEYYKESAYIFQRYKNSDSNARDLKKQRRNSKATWENTFYGATEGENAVEYLKKCILEGKKMNVTYLDYKSGNQEGLHRMMAVADIFGWDTKFPVLIVESDKVLTGKDMEEDIKKWMSEDIDKEYVYDEEEFRDKVWGIIEDHNKELNVTEIKVEIKYHSMHIYLNYKNNEYCLAFSLRDPQNLRESLFHIVEKKPINNEYDYEDIDDEELDELLEDLSWDL